MDLKLAGKVALITGSSRGIGLATAKALAAEGCRLMLSARSAEPLAEAQAALRTSVAEVAAHAADVIAFLASPRAHWINGRNIPVDGLEQPHAPLDRRPF